MLICTIIIERSYHRHKVYGQSKVLTFLKSTVRPRDIVDPVNVSGDSGKDGWCTKLAARCKSP